MIRNIAGEQNLVTIIRHDLKYQSDLATKLSKYYNLNITRQEIYNQICRFMRGNRMRFNNVEHFNKQFINSLT